MVSSDDGQRGPSGKTDATETRKSPRPASWGYVLVIARFFILFLETGVMKAFGVLIADMVDRYQSNYRTMGFICSLITTVMYVSAPLVKFLMKTVNTRILSMCGGVVAGMALIISSYTTNTTLLALCYIVIGLGYSLTNFPLVVEMNKCFGESFFFWNSLANFGVSFGAFALPPLADICMRAYGYHGTFLIIGGLMFHVAVCGGTVRPLKSLEDNPDGISDETAMRRVESSSEEPLRLQEQTSSPVEDDLHGSSRLREELQTEDVGGEYPSVPLISSVESTWHEEERGGTSTSNIASVDSGHLDIIQQQNTDDDYVDEHDKDESPLLNEETQSETLRRKNVLNSCKERKYKPDGVYTTCVRFLRSTIFVKEPLFTLVVSGNFIQGYTLYSWILFLVPHAEWLGLPSSQAVLLATIAGVAGMLGRCLFLLLVHLKFDLIVYYALSFLVSALVFFLDLTGSSFWFLSLTTVIQGIHIFGTDIFQTVTTKIAVKNPENFSSALTVTYVFYSLGILSGDMLSGLIFDVTGSSLAVFLSLGGMNLMVSVLMGTFLIVRRVFGS